MSARIPAALALLLCSALLVPACGDSPSEIRRIPSAVTPLGGEDQTGAVGSTLSDSLVVLVSDQNNQPLQGVTVAWTTTAGSLSAPSVTTKAAGRAAVAWTLGTEAGSPTATATVPGLPPVIFTAEARPGSVASLELAGPANAIAGEAVIFALTARDSYGNIARGYDGTRSLMFSGAASAPDGTSAAVVDRTGSARAFGSEVELDFTGGEAEATTTFFAAESVDLAASDGTFTTGAVEVDVAAGGTAAVEVIPSEQPLFATYTQTLSGTTRDAWGNPTVEILTWSGSGTAASVAEDGLVAALDTGTVTVTARTAGGVEGSASIWVDRFVRIRTGASHTCALASSGAAYCWGGNQYGQLGHGAASVGWAVPTLVSGGHTWQQLSGGYAHTCGITATSDAYCWGDNGSGRLGDGTVVAAAVPRLVTGGHKWTMVSAGVAHSCGITDGGDAYCWGYGGAGERGDDSVTPERTVPGPVHGGHSWAEVNAGGGTCGIRSDGAAYCWGPGSHGQLGNGSTVAWIAVPERVWGDINWSRVSVGYHHVCGMTSTGQSYCWGSGTEGQLGTGDASDRLLPTQIGAADAWVRIGAGINHTCGLTGALEAYCWGSRSNGQLGDGSFDGTSAVPAFLSGGHVWSELGAGGFHTCGITGSGAPYCWGQNGTGQLGTGLEITGDQNVPVKVSAPLLPPVTHGSAAHAGPGSLATEAHVAGQRPSDR